jgi:hypothetical protein
MATSASMGTMAAKPIDEDVMDEQSSSTYPLK